nr:type I restriction endonuclease subunit R [Deltaproteobacteria bacterium]
MATTVHEPDVESVVIQLLGAAGWSAINAQAETFGPEGTLGRANRRETVLTPRLRAALARLNADVPDAAIDRAMDDLTVDRSAQQLADANHTLYRMVKDGVRVTLPDPSGAPKTHVVRVIDWDSPGANEFLLVQQLWVAGAVKDYRADLVGFVNGLPWLFIELKNVTHNAQEALTKNLDTYRANIPQLFWHNAVIVLSNGLDAVMGSLTSSWDRFKAWTRVDNEDDTPGPSLDGVIRGALAPTRLLDLVENFILFEGTGGSAKKVIAQNHQMLGVNRAVAAVERYRAGLGDPASSPGSMEALRRLGVFWHTQGSGKSYSMVFFSQKALRKVTGNWSFVVVTDREELDDQIYKTFKLNGAVGAEDKARATSAANLRTMLGGDRRYVFTLIQKYRPESKGKAFPRLSDRAEIIVMADEAHRSQYDTFAINMRLALPNAAFIGFTGTPLLQGDQTTREVFGDYVSRYRFFDAVRDGATVPLYYEATIPELQLDEELFEEGFAKLLAEEPMTPEERAALENRYARLYALVTRKERLDAVARNLAEHFLGVSDGLKAMVVCIDKATTLHLYKRVQDFMKERVAQLNDELVSRQPHERTQIATLKSSIAALKSLEMAVILSAGEDDEKRYKERKLDPAWVKATLSAMDAEVMAERFKRLDDSLRIAFVCSMWITGFDAPPVGVVYLDRPMRNHALMQTIARANRVYPGEGVRAGGGLHRGLQEPGGGLPGLRGLAALQGPPRGDQGRRLRSAQRTALGAARVVQDERGRRGRAQAGRGRLDGGLPGAVAGGSRRAGAPGGAAGHLPGEGGGGRPAVPCAGLRRAQAGDDGGLAGRLDAVADAARDGGAAGPRGGGGEGGAAARPGHRRDGDAVHGELDDGPDDAGRGGDGAAEGVEERVRGGRVAGRVGA